VVHVGDFSFPRGEEGWFLDPNGLMVIELGIEGKLTNFQRNVISKMKRLSGSSIVKIWLKPLNPKCIVAPFLSFNLFYVQLDSDESLAKLIQFT
jgi:hypothetical protein